MAPQFKRPTNGADNDGKPRKDDLVGALLVITMREYDAECVTKYGTQEMVSFDLTVVDGDHAGYTEEDRAEFGNLAKQIGKSLEPGDTGVGRYTSGEGNQGRKWYGVNWAEDEADFVAAEAAISPR